MSSITLAFEDLTELKEFARDLLKGEVIAKPEAQAQAAQPTAPPPLQTQQPAAYGQQIAQHFPAANTGQAQQQVQQTMTPQPTPQQQAAQQVQTTAPSYKLDDLSGAAMQLMDKGMQGQLQQLLAGYGVDTLPQLPAGQYGNFATALRGMGAQI